MNCIKQNVTALGLLLILLFVTSSQAAPKGTIGPSHRPNNQVLYVLAELKKPDYSVEAIEAVEAGFGLYGGITGPFNRCKIVKSLEKPIA